MFKGFFGDFLGIFIGFFRGFLAVVFSYHKLGLCWCNPLARSAGLFLSMFKHVSMFSMFSKLTVDIYRTVKHF